MVRLDVLRCVGQVGGGGGGVRGGRPHGRWDRGPLRGLRGPLSRPRGRCEPNLNHGQDTRGAGGFPIVLGAGDFLSDTYPVVS